MKPFLRYTILFFSKLLNPNGLQVCRFVPGCTAYALQAVEIHSLLTAIRLIIVRIMKCHPWGSFGHDPVPVRVEKNSRKKL